jgi:glycosyltransferase involved in cell wall biosynthesis
MRVSIDATTLLLPGTGVKNYVFYWLRSLCEAARQRGDTITTYPPFLNSSTTIDHQFGNNSLRGLISLGLVNLGNLRGSPLIDGLLSGADLFHCSQHTRRLPRTRAATATIFEFSCWKTPEYHTAANIAATKRYAAKILECCDGLIAISAHSKQDAVDILGIPEARIRVIYPGVADAFFRTTQQDAIALRTKYGLPEVYILFLGCIEPRKNVLGLIQAYRQLPAAVRREVPLVLAGPFGWKSEAVKTQIGSSQTRYLGYVPETDLPGLIRGSATLVYPSFYEGFGFPVAQAMAAGVPVVTSNRSCLPEVVGDAALVVDPDSPEALAAAIERVLSDSELAKTLASRGQSRAQQYRWPACSAASLDLFHDMFTG